jgi:hypothetical protein
MGLPLTLMQELIPSTTLMWKCTSVLSLSTLWTAIFCVSFWMTFGVAADPKVPTGPLRTNLMLH